MSAPAPPLSHLLRRPLFAFAALVAIASVLVGVLAPIAPASALPSGPSKAALPPPAHVRAPAKLAFSTSIERALARAEAEARTRNSPRAALSANSNAARSGTFVISPAVRRFLSDELGISVGTSDRLTGAVSGHYVVATAGAPTNIAFGLPSGITAPSLAHAELVFDKSSRTLTVAVVSSGGTATSLDVVIPDATTANATGVSGTFVMPVVPLLGGDVALRGPLSFHPGAVVLSADAYDPSATSLSSEVHLEGGTHVSYLSTAGFAVMANGHVGTGADALPVSLSGTIRSTLNWSLAATAASRADTLTVARGFEVEGGFAGTVADSNGSVTFGLSSNRCVSWTPLAATSQRVEQVEYSDATPPAGADLPAGLGSGSPWVLAKGLLAVSVGTSGTFEASGAIVFDLSSHRAALVATSPAGLTLRAGARSSSLRDVTLRGDLTVGADHLEGVLSGKGTVVGAARTSTTADLTLTSTGALYASFSDGTAGTTWSSIDHAAPPPAVLSAPVAAAGTDDSRAAARTGTYTVSAAVLTYLTKTLGIPLGTSTKLSGKLSGKTLTITAGAPAGVTPRVPSGAPALNFKSSEVVVNVSTNKLTVTASASAKGGESSQLSVTVPKADTSAVTSKSGVTATLSVAGLQVFGVPVSLSGSLALTGTPPAHSLTGVIAAGTSLVSGASFAGGAIELSSTGSLKVSGIVTIGTGPTAFNVAVTATLKSLSTWSLKVSDPNAPSWQPISNLVVQPDFTGTIAKSGTVSVSLASKSGGSPVTWVPGANTSVTVSGMSISNAAPPASVTCNSLTAGGLWIGVTGTIGYSVFGASAVSLPGEACIVLGSTVYTTATAATGTLDFEGSLFSIGQLQLIVSGDTASNSFSVTGTAQLTFGSAPPLTLAVNFSATGAFIAAVSLPDLSTLGVAGLNGVGAVWLSTRDIPVFTGEPGLPAVSEFHLRVGLSVTFTYSVPSADVSSLTGWGIPIPSTVQAVASLSPDGFTIEFDLGFGNPGFELFTSDINDPSDPNAAGVYLNDLNFAITLSADPTIEVDGVVTLNLPAITGDSYSQPTSLQLTLSGTISLVSANVSLGLVVTGNCGGQACPWTDAFGIDGLTIGAFGATVGVTFDSGIPTPTLGFSLDGVILPTAVAGPIGLQAGASISIDINFDLTAPVVNLQLSPGSPGTPALLPLEITGIPAVQNAIVIDDAGIFIAPIGGTLANGTTVAPGIAVDFDAYIGGLPVDVDALVSPATLTVSAYISVPSFNLGPVTFGGVHLNLSISPAGFTFEFEASFTSAGFSFDADLDLSAVSSFAGASISLSVTAGLPSFLQVSGELYGSVSVDGSGNFQASTSGSGSVIIAGENFGSVSFSYSFTYGFLWQAITADADQVAQALEYAYGWADQTVTYYLDTLQYGADSIAQALQSAFAGISPSEIASDLNQFVTSSSEAVAVALQSVGYTFDQIGSAIENVYGETEQALQNTLSDIGADAWDVLNALNNVFTSGWDGSFYLSVTPQAGGGVQGAPLFMDVSGASQSAGAAVIDYPWDGGSNQHWYFESLGSGLAYIVNQNSGQCLTIPYEDSNPGDDLEQYPCNGSPEEMWQMDVSQQNLLGPSMYLINAYDGLVVDAAGASWFAANLDQWPINYNWNQDWTASPGLF